MTVAVFVTNESEAASLIPWGIRFARAGHTDLLVVCPRKSKGKRGWDTLDASEKEDNSLYRSVFDILEHQDPEQVVLKQAITNGDESTDLDRVMIETKELVAPSPENAFVEEIAGLDVRLLLLPSHAPASNVHEDEMLWHQKLFQSAPSEVAIVKGSPPECDQPLQVMVVCGGEPDSDTSLSLQRGCQLARGTKGSLALLYVSSKDESAKPEVAQEHLDRLAKQVSEVKIEIEKRIEVAGSICDGVNQVALEPFDLVIIGTRKTKQVKTLLRDLGKNESEFNGSLIAIRESIPVSHQAWDGLKSWVRQRVPQLDRQSRVKLVERLENTSEFNFDFVALISLSTLIAALGLARNSSAVVIGAMLVAPLMSPLVAIGFALVQGNVKLIRSALKSVTLGFTVAVLIGAVLGLWIRLFFPSFLISPEMYSRGSPNLLDLIVALASGVAGAYAMGRPNLISALPGVAIAAALVPPIATSGLALTMGDSSLSGGASLLFFTNIVAIVLGTAITFWAVGISTRVSKKERPQIWPRYWFLAFVVLSFLLAAWMSYFNPVVPSGKTKPTSSNVQAMTDFE
jgi:uncharacterized hydrophobic protein (TIGR00271 family)